MLAKDLSSYYSVNDDKILTETDTETFVPIPNFPKSKPILFSETKLSETDTFFRDQILWHRNGTFFQDQVFQDRDFFRD